MATITEVLKINTYAQKTLKKLKTDKVKIPPKFKEKFIKALKSGKYEQGHGRLCTTEMRYCCLGVACAISSPKEDISGLYITKDYFPKVPIVLIGRGTLPMVLATLNDEKITFKQIATFIEKNF